MVSVGVGDEDSGDPRVRQAAHHEPVLRALTAVEQPVLGRETHAERRHIPPQGRLPGARAQELELEAAETRVAVRGGVR